VFSSAKKLLILERNRPMENTQGLRVLKGVVEERYYAILNLLRNPPSLYNFRAGVIITHTPGTSDAYKTYTRPVEKSITI
jgi:hypothetical protein